MGYVCWLLVKYYQSYVILRQHYLMGGEKQINEWHQQFLDSRAAEAGDSSKPTSRTRSRRNILGEINRVFNPNVQASSPPHSCAHMRPSVSIWTDQGCPGPVSLCSNSCSSSVKA